MRLGKGFRIGVRRKIDKGKIASAPRFQPFVDSLECQMPLVIESYVSYLNPYVS
jgi:hypothetical protein